MTLIDEMMMAGRGTIALIMGRRDASRYFDMTLHGLIGSVIAIIIIFAIDAYAPLATGLESLLGSPWQAFFVVANLHILQMGFVAILLNQIQRLDGLMPFIIADNWVTFFLSVATTIISIAGITDNFVTLVFIVLALITKINIARLIMTLPTFQVLAFLVVQLVAGFVGLMMVMVLFPDLVQALGAV